MAQSWMERMSAVAAAKLPVQPGIWHAWIFRAIEPEGLLVIGACCPLIERGPRKGKPNFRRARQETKREVYLTKSECA